MTWFFNMSHLIMTLDGLGHPPRPAHEELLENQQADDDHATDLLSICQSTHLLGHKTLNAGIIEMGRC